MSKKYSNAIKTFSSKEGRFEFKKEMLSEAKAKKAFDVFKGISKFDAVVLSWHNYLDSSGADTGTAGAGNGNMYLACYVRPLRIEGFLIPPPCVSKNPEMQRCIISLHPIAFSTHAIFDGRETSLKVGDTVTCYFSDAGPAFQGNLKGLRFESSQQKTAVGGFSLECLERDGDKKFDIGNALGGQSTDPSAPRTYVHPGYTAKPNDYWIFNVIDLNRNPKEKLDSDKRTGQEQYAEFTRTIKNWKPEQFQFDRNTSRRPDAVGDVFILKKAAIALDKAQYRVMKEIPGRAIYLVDEPKSRTGTSPAHEAAYRPPGSGIGNKQGYHTKGSAFDIWSEEWKWSGAERLRLFQILVDEGFRGFGHGTNNIHADYRNRPAYWYYPKSGFSGLPQKFQIAEKDYRKGTR